jgi:hypothetical protein
MVSHLLEGETAYDGVTNMSEEAATVEVPAEIKELGDGLEALLREVFPIESYDGR